MRSMTGFGVGHAVFGAGRLCIEVKSLNHRYLDVRVRLPADLGDHAFYLEHLARSRLVRGRFDIQLRTEGQTAPKLCLDADSIRSLYHQLASLRDELTPSAEIPLTALLGLPAVYLESDERSTDRVRNAIEHAFGEAQRRLEEMRAHEGAHLALVLREILARAEELVARCATRATESIQLHRDRLRERVAKLVEDPSIVVEPSRMEQEVAIIADRSDVSEELARLESHFSQLRQLINSDEPSGRRMDFLLQEIGRETNTLGAKSQDARLSHLVVELKAESERMREQVQNVE
jgi:uncharacterized protein (TIGR00255 family)